MALSDSTTAIRTAAILTNSYVASSNAQVGNSSRANIYFDFTLASLTSLDAIVEFSPNGTNWYQATVVKATNGAVAMYPGTFTFLPADFSTTATTAVLSLEVADALMRVKVRGNGTLAASSCAVTVAEGNAD